MKSKTTRLAAAAAIVLAVLMGIGIFDRTSAWAEVLKALEEVNQVCIERTFVFPDGSETQGKWWFRKPNCLHSEESGQIVIDNGRERLTIDLKSQQAQFEDSLTEYRPVSEEEMFEQIELFRGQRVEGLTVKKLQDESDDNISVFHLDYGAAPSRTLYQGKAWVDNNTMLPTRLILRRQGRPKEGEPDGVEVRCDYSPIPDAVFEGIVPAGYTLLPRKRPQAIAGKVANVDGSSVQGATVYLTDKNLRFLRKVETDGAGEFLFKLPPSNVHWVGLPLFLRAVPKDDPEHVAWTIVEDPAKKKDQGVKIPGQSGHVELVDSLRIQSVNGIVLQMERAGAISGCVTDMQGNPISGAEVKIEGRPFAARVPGMPLFPEFGFIGDPLGGDGPRGELTARTDERGRYEVTNVPKLSERNWYKVAASAQGFAPNERRIDTAWVSGVQLVDVQLYRAGITVSGILVDNYGQVLKMREIEGCIGGRDFCRTETDEQGRFILKDCPVSPDLQIKANLAQNTWFHLGQQKRLSYTYYPNVIVPVDYREGAMEYEVKLVGEKPEFTVELEVRNAAGEPVAHYPVELQGTSGSPSAEWQEKGRLTQRTDSKGYCKFTNAPNLKGLRLVVGRAHIFNDTLSKEETEEAKEDNARYQWTIAPVEVLPGRKEYKIEVTLSNVEEFKDGR